MTIDRNVEQQHLNQADTHIADSERRITKQEAILAELRRDGHDTASAEQTLQTLKDTLKAYHGHREVILDTLAKIDAGQI